MPGATQMRSHLAIAVERCLGLLKVDHTHQGQIEQRFRRRVVAERQLAQSNQFARASNAEIRMSRFNHRSFGLSCSGQPFFSPSSSILSRPICLYSPASCTSCSRCLRAEVLLNTVRPSSSNCFLYWLIRLGATTASPVMLAAFRPNLD